MIQTEPPIPTVPAASSSSSLSPPWNELPEDLMANILQRLGAAERLVSARKVCATWWRICKNRSMWRVIDLDPRAFPCYDFEKIWRCAVDLSQGQLLELKFSNYFVDDFALKFSYYFVDDFLYYVAERSSQLRCLTLEVFPIISCVAILKKLTQLEELHLIIQERLTVNDLESIGIACPMLKSFTHHNKWGDYPKVSSDHAVAIGKNMPNLRHLRLSSLGIENRGLEAILDRCPNLELLDLRRCSSLDLKGGLAKRCSDRIKDVMLHSESFDYDAFSSFKITSVIYRL